MNNNDINSLIAFFADGEFAAEAERSARELNLQCVFSAADAEKFPLLLRYDINGLSLTDGDLTLYGDFSRMSKRLIPNNLNAELLVKAARIKGVSEGLTVADATAGLGEDSLLLAAAGFRVTLFERDLIIASLLADALKRAALIPELNEIVCRMKLYKADSITVLPGISPSPDIVLLDPMFPERQKSASVKKKFQLLQKLQSPCTDENELFQAAVSANPRKIVIKRPSKGPYLAGVKPSYSLDGGGIRYDCIVLQA